MMRQRGFTLIELMIVVAIIAIIAAIALPNLLSARLSSNETAAIATVRNICSAQAQFQSLAKADSDYDGMGEYGSFRELSGAGEVRAGLPSAAGVLHPPVLSGGFRLVNVNGETERSGYYFKIYLPDASAEGVCPDETGSYVAVDEDFAETTWCCYAWPASTSSGRRTFMINQTGDIVSTAHPGYAGQGAAPLPGSAFRDAGSINSITGLVAIAVVGRDGHSWKQVN